MVEKRAKNFTAEVKPGIAVELQSTECAAIADLLSVVPRPYYQKNFIVVGIFGLDGLVNGDGAVNIFLVPEAVHQHDRNFERLRGKDFVHGLVAPESVIAGMVEDLAPEADLLQTVIEAKFDRR